MARSKLILIFTSGFAISAVLFIGASLVLAWTGPTSAPPNGNVSAPINVGATDQIKNAGLGINSLAVFGNAILSGTSRYLNFGTTAGSAGYGFRDNSGAMEVKSNTGSWSAIVSASTTFSQIKFSDGTTQTTAASSSTDHFGGEYSTYGGSTGSWESCFYVNPYTNACSCASGYTAKLVYIATHDCGAACYSRLYMCYK